MESARTMVSEQPKASTASVYICDRASISRFISPVDRNELAYDANGNTLTDAQGRSFTCDFENRLVQAVVPGQNGGTTTIKYDPFGRRIQKSGPLGTTNYLYDGVNTVSQTDALGNLLSDYMQSEGVDEPLAELRSGVLALSEQDGLGSVTSLSNASGTLSTSYVYGAFGNTIVSTGSFSNPYRYTARDYDPETELQYSRSRYYDSTLGRFLSEDEAGFSSGSLYPYALNSPLRFVDPSGLSSVDYNADTNTIILYSGDNFDGTIIAQGVAYNHPDSASSIFPDGIYPADAWHVYNSGDSDSPYGSFGNLVFDVPGHTGMSVHSGRVNHIGGRYHWTGPAYFTNGCIRTTDNFMRQMFGAQFMNFNPVRRIRVRRAPALSNHNVPLFWPPGSGDPPTTPSPLRFKF